MKVIGGGKNNLNIVLIAVGEATLGTDAVSGKYMVACMNICCGNMTVFYNESWRKSNCKLE